MTGDAVTDELCLGLEPDDAAVAIAKGESKPASEVERKLRAVSGAVRNCIEAAKKHGVSSLSDEFMKEAEHASKEKQTLERRKTQLTADIKFREKTVADEEIMAKSLLYFGEVVTALPLEDQKELIRLIVREVVVKSYDLKSDPKATEKGVFRTKIRTKCYLINISLFASGLFPADFQTGEISSDLKQIGSRGRARTKITDSVAKKIAYFPNSSTRFHPNFPLLRQTFQNFH